MKKRQIMERRISFFILTCCLWSLFSPGIHASPVFSGIHASPVFSGSQASQWQIDRLVRNTVETGIPVRIGSDHQKSETDGLELIAAVLGVDRVEEINEGTAEHFSWYLRHPLNLNLASRKMLEESGLFTAYQIASFLQYRKETGDLLSLFELASVFGFNDDLVRLLAPFISVESFVQAGSRSRPDPEYNHALDIRTGIRPVFHPVHRSSRSFSRSSCHSISHSSYHTSSRPSAGTSGTSSDKVALPLDVEYGLKYRLDVSGRAGIGFSIRKSLSQAPLLPSLKKSIRSGKDIWPEYSSLSLYYNGVRGVGNIVLGDFNARFGQGLAVWSGFSMSGTGKAGMLQKRGNGISPSLSSSGAYAFHGLAGTFYAGPFSIATFLAVEDFANLFHRGGSVSLLPGLDVSLERRWGRFSLSTCLNTGNLKNPSPRRLVDWKVSTSFSADIKGTSLFSEVAADLMHLPAYACLLGSSFKVGDGVDMVFLLRSRDARYQKGPSSPYHTLSLSGGEHGFTWGTDLSKGKWVDPPVSDGFAMAVRRHVASFHVDVACSPNDRCIQSKMAGDYRLKINPFWYFSVRGSLRLRFSPRISGSTPRISGSFPAVLEGRYGLRLETGYENGTWSAKVRAEGVKGEGWGCSFFSEGGFRKGRVSTFLRGGVFSVDHWDDRIYVYDRDAPANFTNMVAYGRGIWLTSYTSLKLFRTVPKSQDHGLRLKSQDHGLRLKSQDHRRSPVEGKLYVRLSLRHLFHPPASALTAGRFHAKLQYSMEF